MMMLVRMIVVDMIGLLLCIVFFVLLMIRLIIVVYMMVLSMLNGWLCFCGLGRVWLSIRLIIVNGIVLVNI